MLTCPICQAALAPEPARFRCPSGHAFDRAREGYVDLLPVGHGRSGLRGDTRAMARARRRFLDRGDYDKLAALLRDRVRDHVTRRPRNRGRPPAVAEVGCGVGTYIAAVAEALPPDAPLFGFDLSKEALRLAARAHPRITFAVNDVTHRLCLEAGALDALLDVFAPRNPAEFRRVLRPDGLLVVVIPGDDHLAQLRERLPLLDVQPEKRARTLERLGPAFEPVWEEALDYDVTLSGDAVSDLVEMTPSAFHLDDAARAAVAAVAAVASTRVSLRFRVLGLSPA